VRESFFMFWETLWALVLGFSLSGAVQAFVSRAALEQRLGDHRARAVVRASLYGMASSSCSYAAAAMARSLVRKGADFVAAMVFMVASTNLVIELGIVLVVLIGWQFIAAQFVGGVLMIILLAAFGGLVFGRVTLRATRSDALSVADDESVEEGAADPGSRARTLAGWTDAAGYAIADLHMLRGEMVIGYGVAGALTTLVPSGFWNDLFLQGHGFATTLENAFVGPLIALLSFVCSIGNVPLAAALWKGGIGFGGVISFLFADLITMPLLLVYRRFYGTATTLRILGLFWAVMAIAGLVTEELFRWSGLLPARRTVALAPARFSFGPTLVLDVVFLIAFALLLFLHHNRARFSVGERYAIDPVCGMQVERALAPAREPHDGTLEFFCSDHCHERFVATPERFATTSRFDPGAPPSEHGSSDAQRDHAASAVLVTLAPRPRAATNAVDPVCGMTVVTSEAAARRRHNGQDHYFCCEGCATAFDQEPARYISHSAGSQGRARLAPRSVHRRGRGTSI
jgi:hypothetical protein